MSPEEREILRVGGNGIITFYIPVLAVYILFFTILVPIASMVASSFSMCKGHKVAKFQLAIALLGIFLFTGYLATQIAQAFIFLQFFVLSSASLFDRKETINALLEKLALVLQWLPFISPVVNDTFIIWRAWVIFEKRRWALYVSIVLLTLTLGFTLVVVSIYSNPSHLTQSSQNHSKAFELLFTAPIIVSFFTNSIATLFISYRLWIHMKGLNQLNLESRPHNGFFRAKRVMFLLVDTGFIYALLQLLSLILNVGTSASGNIAYIVFTNIYYSVSFVYPALTIAFIRGPFSIAGIHDSTVEIATLSA